jgi:hypothetical protein
MSFPEEGGRGGEGWWWCGWWEESRSATTLFSLLGLLHPAEYFVTIDHSVLWQRHIAWSKPKGEELRHYVTQRYASNMIFLSCLLAAEINVFFNSSVELTDMRHLLQMSSSSSSSTSSTATSATATTSHLEEEITTIMGIIPPHYQLRYWIGIIMLIDASVTLIALVTTFTLWGMVSSISDANTHALLRSSIGQYVTSLPSRFTVGALYLFLLWMMGFIINLVQGNTVICASLVCLVLCLFFQAVIPLSAFGRLIIHTGAMAKRPVLDEALEQELLPSGLHASLLIRATDRRRKYACATDQYRKQNFQHFLYHGGSTTAGGSSSKMNHTTTTTTTSGGGRGGEGGSGRGSFQDSSHNHSSSNHFPPSSSHSSYYHPHQERTTPRHVKRPSSNSSQLVPPRTITATIRTEGEDHDDDDDDGLEEGSRRGHRQRQDSDEITIDFEVGGEDGGGDEEQEPFLLVSTSSSQQERPERHAHFSTTHTTTTTTSTRTPVAESHTSSLVWNQNSPENEDNDNDDDGEHIDGAIGGGLSTHPHHRRMETCDTVGSEFFFPRASILNAALSSRELDDVVQTALRSSSMMTNSNTRADEGSNYNFNNNYNYNHPHYNPHGNDNSFLRHSSSGGGSDNADDEKNVISNDITPTAAQHSISDVSPLAAYAFSTSATQIKDSEASPSAVTTPTAEEAPPPPPPESSSTSSNNNSHNKLNKEQQLNTIGTEGLLGVRKESPRQVPPLGRQGSWKRKSSLSPKPKHSPKQLQLEQQQQQQQVVQIPKTIAVDATGKPQQQQQQQQQHHQRPQKTTVEHRHPLLSDRPLQQQQQQPSKFVLRSNGPGWSSQPASPSNSNNPNQNHSPTPHHRRRLSSGRRSASSMFAFLGGGVDKEEREWEEENEVRAMFDALPSADLDSHDQIMDELEHSQDNNMVLTSMPHPLKKHTSTGSLSAYGRQKQQQQQQIQVYSPFVATLNDTIQTHDSHSLQHFEDSTSTFVYIAPTSGETNSGFGPGQRNQAYQYPKSALRSRTSSMTGSGKQRHRRLHSLPPIMAFEPGAQGTRTQQPLWSSPPMVPGDNNNRKAPKPNDNHSGTIFTNEPPPSSYKASSVSGISPLQVQKSPQTWYGNGRGGTSISPSPSLPSQNGDSRVPRYSHRRSSYSDKDAYEDPDVSGGRGGRGGGGGILSTSHREALTISTTNTNQNPATHPSHLPNPSALNKTATAPRAAGSAPRRVEEDTAKEGTHLLSGKGGSGGSSSSNIGRYNSSS